MKVLSIQDAESRYGKIRNGQWSLEDRWCEVLAIPKDIGIKWINSATGKPTQKVYCNRDMSDALFQALLTVRESGLLGELKTFDGCFQIRTVRGRPGRLSAHAYALAVDCRAKDQPLGGKPVFTPKFVDCWKRFGFDWGGDFNRPDGMHFSYCWEG